MNASSLLAELLKSEDLPGVAAKYADSLSEEFFMVASAYVDMVIVGWHHQKLNISSDKCILEFNHKKDNTR